MLRTLLTSLAVAGLVFCAGGSASAVTVIKATTQAPMGNPPADTLIEWGKAVEKATNGRYKVDVMTNGKFGSAQTESQAVQAGTIQFALTSSGNLSAFMPLFSIFDLPFFFDTLDYRAAKVLAGPAGQAILEKANTKRIRNLAAWSCVPRVIVAKKPVRTLEEFKGLKFRTTTSKMHVAIMKALGSAPVPMPWTECYTSCQQGVIEGLDPEMSCATAEHWEEVAPYWHAHDVMTNVMVFYTNAKWWNKLPAADREIFSNLITEYSQKCMATQLGDLERGKRYMVSKGLDVYIPTVAEHARWVEATRNVHKEFPDLPVDLIAGFKNAIVALPVGK